MDLNNAACHLGPIDPSVGLGLQVAAISDANPDYAGSCGWTLSPDVGYRVIDVEYSLYASDF